MTVRPYYPQSHKPKTLTESPLCSLSGRFNATYMGHSPVLCSS